MPSRRAPVSLLVLLAVLAMFCGCARAPAGDLLAGRLPIASHNVDRPALITDGIAAQDGSDWDTTRTARLDGADAYVEYDLGSVAPIRGAWLHGDNNDTYTLSGSTDGQDFKPIWSATPVFEGGCRARSSASIAGSARYLKLSARGGDGRFAVSELAVWSQVPAAFPPAFTHRAGYPAEPAARSAILLFGLALMVFVLFAWRGARSLSLVLLALIPLAAGFHLVDVLRDGWPASMRSVALMRGTLAAAALVTVAWEAYSPRRWMPDKRAVAVALAVCGLGGVLSFYNLGHPQFWNDQRQEWSFVHVLDLRQYYATAKYFPEIGYFKLYEADVAAYSEDTGIPLDKLEGQAMRDLRTNHMSTVGALRWDIEHVKSRFSPARWEAYKRDARYFRDVMGTHEWLAYMVDLGGNATPVWIGIASAFFNLMPTAHATFLELALLDPLLFAILFVAIWRSFGWRTMLVCMAVFGTNDFVMYGSNWAGAILRHDWLVYLGLGACALKRERWVLGGVLFGLSTSIRAFPAFAVIGMTFPALWWFAERWREQHRRPTLRELYQAQKPTFTVGFASVGAVLALVVITSAIFGPASWISWYHKVGLIDTDAHVNPVSLRTVIAGSEGIRAEVLRMRAPLMAAAALLYVSLLAVACRGKRRDQAAMLGLIFLPVLMFAANYYEHIVCLLPLVAVDRTWRRAGAGADTAADKAARPIDATDAWVWVTLLAMCAVQYFTTLVGDIRLHFYLSSVVLMAAIASMLLVIVRRDAADLVALPEPTPGE